MSDDSGMRRADPQQQGRRIWRFVLTLALVGGTGLVLVTLTFVPWGTDYLHHSQSGWQLFRADGLTYDIEDFGVDASGGGITGIGTLIPGGLLVALAVVFALAFDSDAATEFGEAAYPRAVFVTGRIVGVLVLIILGVTSFSNIGGFVGITFATFFAAAAAGFGIFVVALPRDTV